MDADSSGPLAPAGLANLPCRAGWEGPKAPNGSNVSAFICGFKAMRAMARCAFVLCAALALVAPRANAGETIDAGDVLVEFAKSDARRARHVPECVRYAAGQLRARLGLAIPKRVTVRLLRDPRAFLGMSGGSPVELYAGMAYPGSASLHVNMNAVDRDPSLEAYTRTIRHELVHLAVGHTLKRPALPTWFEEGLACEFASPPRRPGNLSRAPSLKSLTSFPSDKDGSLSRAYAKADSVMRFLMSRRGPGAVKALLERVGAGEGFEDALRSSTGYTTASLDAEWRRMLRPRWGWRMARLVFAPSMVLLWAALIAILGFFVVRRRRRREAEAMDAEF